MPNLKYCLTMIFLVCLSLYASDNLDMVALNGSLEKGQILNSEISAQAIGSVNLHRVA